MWAFCLFVILCHYSLIFFLFFYYYFLVDLVRDQNIYIIMYIVIHFTFILYRLCYLISVALFSVKRNMAPINILSTSIANLSIFCLFQISGIRVIVLHWMIHMCRPCQERWNIDLQWPKTRSEGMIF